MSEKQPSGHDRNTFNRFVVGGLEVAMAAPLAQAAIAAEPERRPQSCREAVERLLGGNTRFVSGKLLHPHISEQCRERLTDGQQPFARFSDAATREFHQNSYSIRRSAICS